MACEGPPAKKRLLDPGQRAEEGVVEGEGDVETSLLLSVSRIHGQLEAAYSAGCLCGLDSEDIHTYIQLNQGRLPSPSRPALPPQASQGHDASQLYLTFICWAAEAFHDQVVEGRLCAALHDTVRFLLHDPGRPAALSSLLAVPEPPGSTFSLLKYSAARALVALLPLAHCGREEGEEEDQGAIQKLLLAAFPADGSEQSGGLLAELGVEEGAGLGEEEGEEQGLQHRAWVVTVVAGCAVHCARPREEGEGRGGREGRCRAAALGEEALCQEVAVRCAVVRGMQAVWQPFTAALLATLARPGSSAAQVFLTEGFRLWQALLSARANLSFLSSRPFSARLPACLPLLTAASPAAVWRAALDTVSEELCYGTTLALQSTPPEEPCQLAHSILRLVRFHSFLTRVPHSAAPGPRAVTAWDRGLVQKVVVCVLKCVALTTREARVDSSSGESDSSLSSRESDGSGGSDMVIIERSMAGVYRVLDAWVREVLPDQAPHLTLQERLLAVLQEQDDVLVEGLLCLLDTHVALHPAAPATLSTEVDPVLDTCPARGFLALLHLLHADSSVLLDFLVSNETCFLLYLLRLLKFFLRDWETFMSATGNSYEEAVGVLLQLKASIARLLSKSLFPYNIGPVYRLLERVEARHGAVLQLS